jgi:DNA modification methylase
MEVPSETIKNPAKFERKVVRLADIKTDSKNPNKMTPEQMGALRSSIEKYGYVIDIIVDKKSMMIADGEHRLNELKALKIEEAEVILYDFEDEADRRLFRQISNKLRGTHDYNLDLEEFKFLFSKMGSEVVQKFLTEDHVGDFLEDIRGEFDDKDDNIPLPRETYIKKGDLYALGVHRLMCGDSTLRTNVERLMGNKTAKCLFTSPPYNMAGDLYETYADDLKSKEYIAFNLNVAKAWLPSLKGYLYWNISYNKNARWEFLEIMDRLVKESGLRFMELIVWNKKHALPIRSRDALTRQYENVLMLGDEDTVTEEMELFWLGTTEKRGYFHKRKGKGITNYWEIGTLNSQQENLKACFPVALPLKGIGLVTSEGDIVVDPFGGSGTTLIACEKTGRKCFTMELDPVYCQIIVDRFEKFTGEKAVKIE